MTLPEFFTLLCLFSLGTCFGVALLSIFVINNMRTQDELVNIAASAQDTELLDFWEKTECSMLFNPTLAAWGLVDEQDNLLATAHSARVTLARAIESEEREVHHVGQ